MDWTRNHRNMHIVGLWGVNWKKKHAPEPHMHQETFRNGFLKFLKQEVCNTQRRHIKKGNKYSWGIKNYILFDNGQNTSMLLSTWQNNVQKVQGSKHSMVSAEALILLLLVLFFRELTAPRKRTLIIIIALCCATYPSSSLWLINTLFSTSILLSPSKPLLRKAPTRAAV